MSSANFLPSAPPAESLSSTGGASSKFPLAEDKRDRQNFGP